MDFTILKMGDVSDKVKILQEKLKILGYYNGIITGSFDLATYIGVKSFQDENNLESNGIVSEEVWDLLYAYTDVVSYSISNNSTLKLGDTSDNVEKLQSILKDLLYYTGDVSKYFDLECEIAVKRLQYHNNITVSGVVDTNTWNVINSLYGNLDSCLIEDNTNEQYNYYTVVSGDTLYSIARKYNTTVDEIKKLNNLNSNLLSIGQVLKVGYNEEENTNNYTVVSGDTLYSIARKYNTTVDEIKKLNNLSSNLLSIGQVLKIPSSNDYIIYTVVSGDTLYSISRKFYTTVDDIKKLNNLNSNLLSIGQQLKIKTN